MSAWASLRLSPKERWKWKARAERMRRKGYSEKEISPAEGKLCVFLGVTIIKTKRAGLEK